MTLQELHERWTAWNAADEAWSRELIRTYGSDACNARYESRGKATPELARLCAAFMAAGEAWTEANDAWRKQQANAA
ncbi:hypothetical protein [Tardibacter chloracetimidivorans]|nr:hypothetical protein [Tardibacter chloracetimidivorans]